MVERRDPPAAAREAKAEASSPNVPPQTDRALVPGEQHAGPETTLAALDQETCSVLTELFAIGKGKDCKPEATVATTGQPPPATTQVQAINNTNQHTEPETTLRASSQAHVITTITKTHADGDDPPRKTTKRSDVAREHGTLSTQRVFNTSATS
ncbi:hypothetical protein PG984_002355 [Apiospora sp. TS-2023a]